MKLNAATIPSDEYEEVTQGHGTTVDRLSGGEVRARLLLEEELDGAHVDALTLLGQGRR